MPEFDPDFPERPPRRPEFPRPPRPRPPFGMRRRPNEPFEPEFEQEPFPEDPEHGEISPEVAHLTRGPGNAAYSKQEHKLLTELAVLVMAKMLDTPMEDELAEVIIKNNKKLSEMTLRHLETEIRRFNLPEKYATFIRNQINQ